MGIVLGETAHAGEAVQLARLLVAVHGAELGVAHGQVAVAAGLGFVDFAVVRAVHRLEEEFLAGVGRFNGLEGVRTVFLVVAAGHVQLFGTDVGRDDGLVAGLHLGFAQKLLEALAQGGAFGQPQGQPRSYFLRESKQLQLFAQLAVVATLGFFQALKVLGEVLGFGKGDAVEARELLVLFIAAPVSAGHVHQLGRLDGAGVGNVRATAEVGKTTLRVKGDFTVFEVFEQLQLVGVLLFGEIGNGISLRDFLADVAVLLLGQLQHFLLDFGKVLAGNAAAFAEVDVVVEAVFDGRADGQLHAGVQCLKGFGHEVGRGMPVGGLTSRVVPGQDFDGSIFSKWAVQVADFAVDAHGQSVAGQAFADAVGQGVAGSARLDRANRAVGEGDVEHESGVKCPKGKAGRKLRFAL